MKRITVPILMISCSEDITVCRDSILREYENLRTLDKTHIEFDSDHFIWQDGENLQNIVREITEWMSLRN